jgi:tripartite ATP-independent transporter DctP family solute receptor
MQFFGDRVQERSEGAIVVEIFSGGQLGTERETIEQVQLGIIHMAKASTANLESFVPVMGIFSYPYLFEDSQDFWEVLHGPIGKELLGAGKSVGVKGLCYYDAGARSFYTRERRIESPADLTSLKIRSMPSKTSMETLKELGANPAPIPWGELYTSLQQGVVDGAENNPPSFLTSRHYEVCKFFSLDEHTRIPDILLIGEKVWIGLSDDVRDLLQAAANESSAYQRELWKEETELALESMEKSGVEISRPEKELFKQRTEGLYRACDSEEIAALVKSIKKSG